MELYRSKMILVFGVALIFFSCAKTYTKEDIDKVVALITSKYGTKIIYKINGDFAPIRYGWAHAQFNRIEKIAPCILVKYPAKIAMAFDKYPVKVIKENINAIYFAKEMESNGLQYGGTYDSFRRIIYLVNDGEQTDDRSIAIIYHEFSSLLLYRYGFFTNPCLNQNPKGFKYRSDMYSSWEKAYNGTSLVGTIDPVFTEEYLLGEKK
jgi:hypothetical protein